MVGTGGPLRPLSAGLGLPLGPLGLLLCSPAGPLGTQLLGALRAVLHGAEADAGTLGAALAVHVRHDPKAEGLDLLRGAQPHRRCPGVPACAGHGAGVELDERRVQLWRGRALLRSR